MSEQTTTAKPTDALVPSSQPPNEEESAASAPEPAAAAARVEPLPLDWTKLSEEHLSPADRIRYPWDVEGWPILPEDEGFPSDEDNDTLTIVGTAGQKITAMGGSELARRCGSSTLRSLILRSHLIQTMTGLGGFDNLELLELYDNVIDSLDDLNSGDDGRPGVTLRVLDMSYNVVRDMEPVQFCPNLIELYLANNKLKSIAGLRNLSKLKKLDLGANRIRIMDEEELSGLVNVEELWLGKNKIETIQGLSNLVKLRRLDVQSNRLTSIENLTVQVDTLEELYLAHNGIDNDGATRETGLALPFTKLNMIDLSRNRLTSTSPFAHIVSLEELWISGNDIRTFEDVGPISVLGAREGACLEGIYLEYNPVASDFEYRKRLAEMIPSLNQIDADVIGAVGAYSTMNNGRTGGGSLQERMKQFQEEALARAIQQQNKQSDDKEKD